MNEKFDEWMKWDENRAMWDVTCGELCMSIARLTLFKEANEPDHGAAFKKRRPNEYIGNSDPSLEDCDMEITQIEHDRAICSYFYHHLLAGYGGKGIERYVGAVIADFLLSVLEPMEEAIRVDYDRRLFNLLREIYNNDDSWRKKHKLRYDVRRKK